MAKRTILVPVLAVSLCNGGASLHSESSADTSDCTAMLQSRSEVVIDDVLPQEPACEDKYSDCKFWASIEECDKNPEWMLENCPASCNKCPHGENGNDFADADPMCKSWADNNECNNSPEWMWANCPVSCSRLPDAGEEVQDKHAECGPWASTGECDKNPDWMLANCGASCMNSEKPLPTTASPPLLEACTGTVVLYEHDNWNIAATGWEAKFTDGSYDKDALWPEVLKIIVLVPSESRAIVSQSFTRTVISLAGRQSFHQARTVF
jgi:hypothetical protein